MPYTTVCHDAQMTGATFTCCSRYYTKKPHKLHANIFTLLLNRQFTNQLIRVRAANTAPERAVYHTDIISLCLARLQSSIDPEAYGTESIFSLCGMLTAGR